MHGLKRTLILSLVVFMSAGSYFYFFTKVYKVAYAQEATQPAPEQATPEAGTVEQAGAGEGEEAKAKEEKGIIGKLIEAYVVGDWPMHFILLMLLVIIGLSIERFIAVYVTYGRKPREIFLKVKDAFEEGGLQRALEVAESLSKFPLGSILYSALKVIKETNTSSISEEKLKELVNSVAEEEYLKFTSKIQARIPLIHIFANTAVLLGLLGAVIGLIEAFGGVGALDPAQRQIYLSKSIAIVMHSTAFGLITAILGVVLFAIVSSRANGLISDIEEYSVRAVNWVSLMVSAESTKGKTK